MWQMYAIICVVTMMECNVMYENPSRTFETKAKCQEAAEVDFFGTKSMTSDGAASLALKYGYPVIPMNVEREKGSNFKVTFYEEIKINISDNNQDNIKKFTEEINKFLETCIRKKPEDWFWIHNRWDKRFNLD